MGSKDRKENTYYPYFRDYDFHRGDQLIVNGIGIEVKFVHPLIITVICDPNLPISRKELHPKPKPPKEDKKLRIQRFTFDEKRPFVAIGSCLIEQTSDQQHVSRMLISNERYIDVRYYPPGTNVLPLVSHPKQTI